MSIIWIVWRLDSVQSIHDNEIVSYNIDLQNAKITLHTLGGKGNLVPVTIEFVNVLMHRFETQLRGALSLILAHLKSVGLSKVIRNC